MIRVLLLAILIVIAARLFWRIVDAAIETAGGRPARGSARKAAAAVKLQRDPVCGTFVTPATAITLTKGDATLYFCSERCRDEYSR